MKTPMQEFIESITLKDSKDHIVLIPTISKAEIEAMLEKEKEVAQQYARFAMVCDSKELPVLEFDGWINL